MEKFMKKIALLAITLISAGTLLFIPHASWASEYIAQQNYTIAQDKTIENNIYVVGSTVTLNGTAAKDFIAGGNTVDLSGVVKDDAIIGAGTVTITGTIEGDLRIAAGTVIFSGTVLGDVNIAGGTVTFNSDATVKGDVSVASGIATINGSIEGNVNIAGGEVTLAGAVQQNVNAKVGTLNITDTAHINGNLTYESTEQAAIATNAQIDGSTHFNQHNVSRLNMYFGLAGISIASFIFSLIGGLIGALILVFALKGFSTRIIQTGISSFWRMVLNGLVLGIVLPVASIILMVTVAGIPLGVMLFVIYSAFMVFGALYAGIILGAFIMKWIQKKDEVKLNWQAPVLGIILINAVAVVPIIGWVVAFIFFLAGVGAFTKTLYSRLSEKA